MKDNTKNEMLQNNLKYNNFVLKWSSIYIWKYVRENGYFFFIDWFD